jgi:hypothetical protein
MAAAASSATSDILALAAVLLGSDGAIERAANKELVHSASTGDLSLVRSLLRAKVSPMGGGGRANALNPLLKAVEGGHTDVVMSLLEAKAPVRIVHFNTACHMNTASLYPLVCQLQTAAINLCDIKYVVRNGLTNVLVRLLEMKARTCCTARHGNLLELAVQSGHVGCIKALFSKTTVRSDLLLFSAVRHNDLLLFSAVRHNNVRVLRLLTRDCKVTFSNNHTFLSCFTDAVRHGACAALCWLLDSKRYMTQHPQRTASMLDDSLQRCVSGRSNASMIMLLLKAKAQPRTLPHYRYEPTLVCAANSPGILELLLKTKANPDVLDNNGFPFLCRNLAPAVITLLVEAKADVNVRCPDGRTPLYYNRRLKPSCDLLLAGGAVPEPQPNPIPVRVARSPR